MAIRKRQSVNKLTYVEHVVRITKAETYYSFSAEREWYAEKAYRDMHHLTLTGHFLSPQKLAHQQVSLSLIGDRDCLAKEKQSRDVASATSIGELSLRADRNQFLGVLPQASLWDLAFGIDRGVIKYARLNGAQMRGRVVKVNSASFVTAVDHSELD